MAHALDQHAEKAYGELQAGRQQEICEKIFKAITDRGTDARGIRRPTRLTNLCSITQASLLEATQVIDVFRKPSRSFLMPPLPELLEPDTVIDISHESLMRVWERLTVWSDEEAQSTQLYRRLSETASLHARGKAGPWRDPELQVALDWREKERPTAAWAEQYGGRFEAATAFLDKSEAVRREEIRENEDRQRQDLEHEKTSALAAEQQLSLAIQLKSTRRLRWLAVALGLMFIATLILSVFATVFQRRFEAVSEIRAREQTVMAMEQREMAERQREMAERQREMAQREAARAESVRLSFAKSLEALFTKGGKEAVEAVVDANSAALVRRVYMHIVDKRNHDYAKSTSERLREQGFTVLGIDFVPKAAMTLRSTQVRYYKKADEDQAERLVELLSEAGEALAEPVYLVNEEDNPNIRQNHFEVWFPRKGAKRLRE